MALSKIQTDALPTTYDAEVLLVAGGGSGGGAGSADSAGGGGAGGVVYTTVRIHAGESYTVTIGAGGALVGGTTHGNNGGNTTFGSHVTGYGGRAGYANNTGSMRNVQSSTPRGMGDYSSSTGETYESGSLMAGGFGGTSMLNNAQAGTRNGGNTLYGGGGGAGNSGSAGSSFFGGDGGSWNGGNGATPGGGGGGSGSNNSGSGGDGECWVIVL